MRFLDEYRDANLARRYAEAVADACTRPWTIMEICGGQTHSIVRFGIDQLLPKDVTLVHGPGCPVCVTPVAKIDQAIALAGRADHALCSFGDMLRVPGSSTDLLTVKASGGDVRIVYSPLDAVAMAQKEPGRQFTFFAVGFETTAPANALAVKTADRLGLDNFTVLVAHVRVPPAMEAILASPGNLVQGFLAAGHVCSVMGVSEYAPIAERFGVPIIVTGFEPADILQGILMCVRQLEAGRHEVENPYARVVRPDGNLAAKRVVDEVFKIGSRDWRGLGTIPDSGLRLTKRYERFDAEIRFGLGEIQTREPVECQAAQVLQGRMKPCDCPEFGTRCTPESPLGAPMVSSEGACAAYYRYRRSGTS